MLIVLLAADWVRLKTANMILSSSPVPVGQENTSLALYIQFTKTAGKMSPLLTEQWWQSKSRLCMYIGLYTLDRAVAFCFLLKFLLRNHCPLGFAHLCFKSNCVQNVRKMVLVFLIWFCLELGPNECCECSYCSRLVHGGSHWYCIPMPVKWVVCSYGDTSHLQKHLLWKYVFKKVLSLLINCGHVCWPSFIWYMMCITCFNTYII